MTQSTGALSPFVYWGQTHSTISLKIDLKNVKVLISILHLNDYSYYKLT